MLASVLLSVISLLVEMVGMRCTTFMAKEPEQKDKVALAGGVIFVIAGQLTYFTKAKPRVSVSRTAPLPVTLKQGSLYFIDR